MAYRLIITEHADELLDHLIYHLQYHLKNEQAVRHLLDGMEGVYDRLEENPLQFPLCNDLYLAGKGYHEAIVPQMNYIVVFCVAADTVYVTGIFHQLENYPRRL